jgi:hypothetical protein
MSASHPRSSGEYILVNIKCIKHVVMRAAPPRGHFSSWPVPYFTSLACFLSSYCTHRHVPHTGMFVLVLQMFCLPCHVCISLAINCPELLATCLHLYIFLFPVYCLHDSLTLSTSPAIQPHPTPHSSPLEQPKPSNILSHAK